jgi:ParB/RepB/Spo0J family partition protein
MATASIPFEEIGFHPEIVNPREELRDINELEASIRAVGLQVPLTVLHRENKRPQNGEPKDKYFLVVGFRRHEALRRIRESDANAFRSVEVKKFKGSIIEAQVLNLTENIQRDELTHQEIANGVEILFNLGYKQKEISEKIGKSQTWVSNTMQFRRQATPQLKNAVKEGKIPYGFARQIATLEDSEQRKKVSQIVDSPPDQKVATSTDEAPATKIDTEVRKEVRESSGRIIRPTTAEVRHEVNRLGRTKDDEDFDDFNAGVLTALMWTLGEKKTLKRPAPQEKPDDDLAV